MGAFVAMDWRVMGLAGHVSHGPGLSAGALFFDHLKLGAYLFMRPGPINPATFEVQAAGGQTYKGSSTLRLRSDGAFIGAFIAPVFSIPGLDALSFELPVAVGMSGFGFYLTGDDRVTPDGRRVSAWENELLGGRDASFAMGLEAGLRVALRIEGMREVQPYIGAHYHTAFGYDTYVKPDYDGFSGAIGVQFGAF
ncbi:MAG TPA: hypothetical protein VLS89_07660 [Candidatus Nanopelagicales bacterium]|nr:hypothetical protein [Candidatus Nanopelagicales bacterium]